MSVPRPPEPVEGLSRTVAPLAPVSPVAPLRPVAPVAPVPVAPVLPPSGPQAIPATAQSAVPSVPYATPPHPGAHAEEAASEDQGLHLITSPIVGTFYRAPSPNAESFVRIGSHVESDTVVFDVDDPFEELAAAADLNDRFRPGAGVFKRIRQEIHDHLLRDGRPRSSEPIHIDGRMMPLMNAPYWFRMH